MTPSTNTPNVMPVADAAPPIALGPDPVVVKDEPKMSVQRLALITFQLIYDRIGVNAEKIRISLQQKNDDLSNCETLLQSLKSWNTPPFVLKTPPDPFDPVNEDRVTKTDAFYELGISIPDDDYDAVKYAYGDPPKVAYSSLPIPSVDLLSPTGSLVNGQIYQVKNSGTPSSPQVVSYVVYENAAFRRDVKSTLPLKEQHGTDFSSLTPGDLVQDLDTGKYYRVSNAKTGVEVTGYPLQKFVQSPDDDVINSLGNQINRKISIISDLSKGESLEMQKLQGFLTTVVNTFTNLIGDIGTTSNSLANKIS